MWRWVSMNPGVMMPPVASISSASAGTSSFGPTAVMVSPVTSTSAFSSVPAESIVMTVALRKTTGRPEANSAGLGWVVMVLQSALSG
jgi:hypothetical protein